VKTHDEGEGPKPGISVQLDGNPFGAPLKETVPVAPTRLSDGSLLKTKASHGSSTPSVAVLQSKKAVVGVVIWKVVGMLSLGR